MKEHSTAKYIANNQQNSAEWLQELHPLPRFALGLLASAALAWYIPQLLVMITLGIWKGVLNMWLANAIGICVLVIINLIGNKLKRIFLSGAVVAMLLACYEVWFTARTQSSFTWQGWMPQIIIPPAIFLLNAYLLIRYKRVANLETDKDSR